VAAPSSARTRRRATEATRPATEVRQVEDGGLVVGTAGEGVAATVMMFLSWVSAPLR
jgi:hypothetical protein